MLRRGYRPRGRASVGGNKNQSIRLARSPMSQNASSVPSVVDNLCQNVSTAPDEPYVQRQIHKVPLQKRKPRSARKLELPRDRLAITFQECRQASGLSFSKLAEAGGIDVAHIWRIEQGEHQNVSREILILLSMAMVLDTATIDRVVEVANQILDAAGLKMLRASWEEALGPQKITDDKSRQARS